MADKSLGDGSLISTDLEIEKIAGAGSDNVAGNVFVKKIALGENSTGTLILVVHCAKKDAVLENLPEVTGDIFGLFSKKLETIETSTLEALRLSTEVVLEYLADKNLEVNFALLLFYNNICYVKRWGEDVKILLFDEQIPSGKRVSGEIGFESGSGPARPGQIYLVATEQFLSIFDKSALFAREVDLGEIIDGVATEISALGDQSGIAAAFIRVKPHGEERGGEGEEGEEDREGGEEEEDNEGKGEPALPRRSPLQAILQEIKALRLGNPLAVLRLRRNIVILACLLLLILASSVFFALKASREKEARLQFSVHFAEASAKYNEGAALIGLNRPRAREILIDADREIKLAQGFITEGEAQKLADEIAARLKETEVTSDVNFEILADSVSANSISIFDKKLWAITESKLFEINLSDKTKGEFETSGSVKSGFVYEGGVFILTDDKVARFDLSGEETKDLVGADTAHDIAIFFGNIYLLSSSQIAKFVPIDAGYSEGVNYLEQEVEFGPKSRFAIDGSIWVSSGSKIFKFTRGEQESFEISGLESPGEFGAIYTSAEVDNIYVCDMTNSALLVIGKDGVYKKAYQSPEFLRTSDIVVDEDETRMYISTADKIMEASLE